MPGPALNKALFETMPPWRSKEVAAATWTIAGAKTVTGTSPEPVAAALKVTVVAEGIAVMKAPAGMPVPLTACPTERLAVEGSVSVVEVAVDIRDVDWRTILGTETTWLPPPEARSAPEARFKAERAEPAMPMPVASVSANARKERLAVRSSVTPEVTRRISAAVAALTSMAAE